MGHWLAQADRCIYTVTSPTLYLPRVPTTQQVFNTTCRGETLQGVPYRPVPIQNRHTLQMKYSRWHVCHTELRSSLDIRYIHLIKYDLHGPKEILFNVYKSFPIKQQTFVNISKVLKSWTITQFHQLLRPSPIHSKTFPLWFKLLALITQVSYTTVL